MRLFEWIRRSVAEAVKNGLADGAREGGLIGDEVPEDAAAEQLALLLADGRLKQLPPKKGSGK